MTMYIPGWEEHFEISQSKRVPEGKALSWVAMPTSHQSREYRRILRSEHGPSVFGAWCAIVQLAAKMPKRGTLADKSGPLEIEDIADEIGFPCEIVRHAVSVLMSDGINWLHQIDASQTSKMLRENSEHAPSTVDDSIPTGQDRTGHNKTGQEKEKSAPPPRLDQGPEAFDLKTIPGILAAFQDINPAWGRGLRAEMAITNRLRGQSDPEILAVTIGKFLEILATEHASPDAPFPLSRLTTWIGNSDKDAPQSDEEELPEYLQCCCDDCRKEGVQKIEAYPGYWKWYCQPHYDETMKAKEESRAV